MKMTLDPVVEAGKYKYVRESSQNNGRRVNGIQTWRGGKDAVGKSWCCYFVMMILDICFQGESPFGDDPEVMGSTNAALDYARKKEWIVDWPLPGDLIFSVHPEGHPEEGKAHHVAICSNGKPLKALAGNTSEDGKSSNGDRVADHEISPENKVFVSYPRAA